METKSLVDRLAEHRTLKDVPREQLEWLVAHGTLHYYTAGTVRFHAGEDIDVLQVLLSGSLTVHVTRGGARRKVAEWGEGDVTGNLPYSRMTSSPGDVVIKEDAEILTLHRDHFPDLIRQCYDITRALVHVMVDRARLFKSSELHDEKMASLGRLSAGLAHELNNPSSAIVRSARSFDDCVTGFDAAARALGAAHLPDAQLAVISELSETLARPQAPISPVARASREDAVTDWLEDHGIDSEDGLALVDAAVDCGPLDTLANTFERDRLPVAVRYLSAIISARKLASEIGSAASRIHALVSAVKGFTYMDQADVPLPVDLGRGLADTVTMLGSKARVKKVDLTLDVPPDLPTIDGFGGELNQVWLNLIDNALDAVPEAGHVTVSASTHGDRAIVVRVVDDGPGIPEAIRERIFDPFFTTKQVGEGTGLGLDIARRLVERQGGEIAASSGAGGTEFRVTLPRRPETAHTH